MASFTFEFSREFEEQLLALERAGQETAVKKILSAGGGKVESEMKRQCAAHKESGDMLESIRTTKAKKNDKGYFVVTRPTGKSTKELKNGKVHIVRNAAKLAYLHYGTSRQRGTGIVTNIVRKSERPALSAMQNVFNEEVRR